MDVSTYNIGLDLNSICLSRKKNPNDIIYPTCMIVYDRLDGVKAFIRNLGIFSFLIAVDKGMNVISENRIKVEMII
jgi:hypothetical protein